MINEKLEKIATRWDYMTSVVLDLQEISLAQMQTLLRDTYEVLSAFHKDGLIPKKIAEIFLNMDEYLYFASLIEEREVPAGYYWHRQIYSVVKALKTGFFTGGYEYAYPKLQLYDDAGKEYVIDMESDDFPLLGIKESRLC